jgi:hypothetical protein
VWHAYRDHHSHRDGRVLMALIVSTDEAISRRFSDSVASLPLGSILRESTLASILREAWSGRMKPVLASL